MSGGTSGWRKLLASIKLSARVPGRRDFWGLSWVDAVIFIPRIFREPRHRVAFCGIRLHSRSVTVQIVCAGHLAFHLVTIYAHRIDGDDERWHQSMEEFLG